MYPNAGYTPFRGTNGTVREGGNRVPAIVRWPGKIEPDTKNAAVVGGPDLIATFAKVAGRRSPERGPRGRPDHLRQLRDDPCLVRHRSPECKAWFYFTENELTPGAVRVGHYKAVFDLRGDEGADTGGLAVDSNLGWKVADSYVPPYRRSSNCWRIRRKCYGVFMNNFTELT